MVLISKNIYQDYYKEEFYMSVKTITNEKSTSLSKVRYLTMTGFMAALITIMTAYICHIPVGMN